MDRISTDRQALSRRSFLKFLTAAGAGLYLSRLAEMPFANAAPVSHVEDTFAAVCDTLFPATPDLPQALSATSQGAHRFMVEAFDAFLAVVPTQQPGVPMSAIVAGTLDSHALQVTPGKRFIEQSPDERLRTLQALDDSPVGDVRFVSFALTGMAGLGFYTEYPGYGARHTGMHEDVDLDKLPVWREIRFDGPKDGYRDLYFPYRVADPVDPTTI